MLEEPPPKKNDEPHEYQNTANSSRSEAGKDPADNKKKSESLVSAAPALRVNCPA